SSEVRPVVGSRNALVRVRHVSEPGIGTADGLFVESMVEEELRRQSGQEIEHVVIHEGSIGSPDVRKDGVWRQRDFAPGTIPEEERSGGARSGEMSLDLARRPLERKVFSRGEEPA